MEKNEKDKRVGVPFCCVSSKSVAKWLYLKKNTINLSHTMKEKWRDLQLVSHHGLWPSQTICGVLCLDILLFFLPSTGIVTWGFS